MISSSYIREYLLGKFNTNYRISSDDSELIVPSVFLEYDYKRHMSINLDNGLWRCFKTGNKGNFITLYAKLENISYQRAYEKFLIETFLADDEVKKITPKTVAGDTDKCFFQPVFQHSKPYTVIGSLAWMYLEERGVWDWFGANRTFYASSEGFFRDRVIIPYRIATGDYMYFQGRALLYGMQPKYLNARNIPSANILYPFEYDSTDPLYICEGAIDAITLQNCGLNATTTISCSVSKAQLDQLKQYRGPIVVCYDNDNAGLHGIKRFDTLRREARMPEISVAVPFGSKDWNDFYLTKCSRRAKCLSDAIQSATTPYFKFSITRQLDALEE